MKRTFIKSVAKVTVFCQTLLSCLGVGSNATGTFAADARQDGYAYAILGERLEENGLELTVGDVNTPIVSDYEGVSCWALDPTIGNATRFIYVNLEDDIAYQMTDGTNFEVVVEYMDNGHSSLTLEYPYYAVNNNLIVPTHGTAVAEDKFVKELDYLDFTDTNTWKKHKWLLQAPSMKNAMKGADFRIGVYSDTMGFSTDGKVYIKSISVKKLDTKDQVGIDIDSELLGNIFYTGEPMSFEVTFDPGKNERYKKINQSYKAQAVLSLIDDAGEIVRQETREVSVSPDKLTKTNVSFDVDTYGLYKIKAELISTEKNIYSEYHERCSYVRSEKGKILNPKAGISVASLVDGELSKWHAEVLANAGFSSARMHYGAPEAIGTLTELHRPDNVAMRPAYDEYIQDMKAKGIDVTCYFSSQNNEIGKTQQIPNTPLARRAWLEAEMEFIGKLYGSISLWETINEPNFRIPQKADYNMQDTADLINATVPVLKENFRKLTIGGPQLGHVANKYNWVGQFIETGAMDLLDVYTLHMYTWDDDPITLNWWTAMTANGSTLQELVDLFEKNNIDKEVYVTEYGYSAFHQVCTSEWLQACWNIQNTIELLKDDFSQKNFIFRLDNAQVNKRTEREHNFGLVRSVNASATVDPGAAKEQYLAFSNFNHEMYDAEYRDYYQLNENTECMRFYKTETQEDLLTMFTNSAAEVAHLDLGTNSVTVTDLYGNTQKIDSVDGTYTFPISEAPCFIKGKFKKCEYIEESSVMPETVLLAVDYNSEYELKVFAPEIKGLKVSAETMYGSEIEVTGIEAFKDGTAKLKFRTGSSAPKGKEPVKLTVSDEKNIYFCGDISFNYASPVEIFAAVRLNADGSWTASARLTNLTAADVSGTLKFVAPQSWAENVKSEHVTIEVGETKNVELLLPEGCESEAENIAQLAFIIDGANDSAVYYNKAFDFVAVKHRPEGMTVDGKLDDWADAKWINLDKTSQFVEVHGFDNIYRGLDDIKGKMALMWDSDRLYIAADIEDDLLYCQGDDPSRMWSLDSLQFAIVYDPDNAKSYTYFVEIACGLFNGTPTAYRHKNIINGLMDHTNVKDIDMQIVRDGNHTKYEIAIPWYSMFETRDLPKVEKGQEFKFSALINENDTGERKGYYEFGSGIGATKNSQEFRSVSLSD